jgi:hypothetical protein
VLERQQLLSILNSWNFKMKFIHLAAIASLVLAFPTVGNAQALTSEYMDTQSCRTIEEKEDLFTLKCPAPAGEVSAILSYWDGRAFVVYEPFLSNGSSKVHLRNIANSAPRAFGQKVEWRIRLGEQQPCAAIVRVFSTKAGVLVVNNTANGKHLGDARTNEQARKLADEACLSGARNDTVAMEPGRAAPASPSPVASAETETVAQAASRGEQAFQEIYQENGIAGAIEEIKSCYLGLRQQSDLSKLAYCAAMDILAGNVDVAMTQNQPDLAQGYFGRGIETDKRITNEMQNLGLDQKQRSRFDQEIAQAMGLVPNDAMDTKAANDAGGQGKTASEAGRMIKADDKKQKSVFEF